MVAHGRRGRNRRRGGFNRFDRVPFSNESFREDGCSQSATVDETAQDAFAGQSLEVRARFAQPHAPQPDVSDAELSAYKMIERDSPGHDVPTGGPGFDRDVVVSGHRLDRFEFDEGDLASGPGRARIRAGRAEVAIAFEPFRRHGTDLRDCDGRRLGLRRDVD